MGLRDDVFGAPFGAAVRGGHGTRLVKPGEPVTRMDHFFHGTGRDLTGETHLKPSAVTGHENYDYDTLPNPDKRRNSVFMTDREPQAWDWANHSSGGRRTVHTVEPRGEVSPDSVVGGAFMAPSARITGRIDIPPAEAVQGDDGNAKLLMSGRHIRGVQGTLPPVNWRQFRDHDIAEGNARESNAAYEEVSHQIAMSRPNPNQGSMFDPEHYSKTAQSILAMMKTQGLGNV